MPVGRAPDGTFRTPSAAAWPPLLCERIASLIVADFLKTLKKGDDKHEEAQAGHGVPTLGPAEVERTNETNPKFSKKEQREDISRVLTRSGDMSPTRSKMVPQQ